MKRRDKLPARSRRHRPGVGQVPPVGVAPVEAHLQRDAARTVRGLNNRERLVVDADGFLVLGGIAARVVVGFEGYGVCPWG